jgi:hypothetical protein
VTRPTRHRPGHRAAHLVRRFWWAVFARRPSAAERRWVEDVLAPCERALFDRLARADQEHHLRVARRLVAQHAPGPVPREWIAAALLHDVGKLVCGLGTWGRVWATLWPWGRAGDGRFARYHRHAAIGASMLRAAGSDPVTVALVGEWPDAPPAAAQALYRADDL